MDTNKINEAIHNHYRKFNRGRNNAAWVDSDELGRKLNFLALRWHNFMDIYTKWFHLKRTANFVLKTFPEVKGVFISGSLITRNS